MTSAPDQSSFVYGSASSTTSVRDAIAAWRRSQYFATSNIPSTSDLSDDHVDEEAH
ncbi:hypothetical protein SERLADRAFT_390439, partial [Serpula lacrymans var. lacrymans S7.9]